MKSIILFRFYKDFDVYVERVKILKHLNPELPIYGLYGGPNENFSQAKEKLESHLLEIKISTSQDVDYKWFHPDQTLKEWYLDFGKSLDFDFLYDYEYDILTLRPLSELYPSLDERSVVLSGIEKFEDIKETWDWTSLSPYKESFDRFRNFMKETYDLDTPALVSLGPGPRFPKKFLDSFCKAKQPVEIIKNIISEAMYPYYAEALGYNIVNSGLHPRWEDKELCQKYFNCEDIAIKKEAILDEIAKTDGVRAFHPVKYNITLEEVKSWNEKEISVFNYSQ